MEKNPVILVVDDISVNLDLIKAQLRDEPYEVRTATSGPEALKMIEQERPDMVLLDIMMPEMDGFEVLKNIRKNPATKTLPVVMLTALSEYEHQEHAQGEGCDGYLTKPLIMSQLDAMFEKFLKPTC